MDRRCISVGLGLLARVLFFDRGRQERCSAPHLLQARYAAFVLFIIDATALEDAPIIADRQPLEGSLGKLALVRRHLIGHLQRKGLQVDLEPSLAHLARVLSLFESSGFEPFARAWTERHIHRDRPVALTLPDGGTLEGTARGVDTDGALLLQTRSGMRRVFGGEVSLRERQ